MASSKVYIGNLGENGDKEAIEQEFSKFGLIKDVWIARNPPGFAFVVYNDPRDAEEAVRIMDNKRLCGAKIKVELSHTEDGRSSRRGDRGSGRGRGRGGFHMSGRDRESPPRRFPMTSPQSSRPQSNRGPPPRDVSPRRSSYDSPRAFQSRGPPSRGQPQRNPPQRRSMERMDNGGPFRERERFASSGPPRERYGHERNSSIEGGSYERYRNEGYRGEAPSGQNGYERHGERYPDRYNDRYPQPAPQERFREPYSDRGYDRAPERGPDRYAERGMDRPVDRYPEQRYARRSPPPRGPPMTGRLAQRSPPPRRGGRSPIARGWGRSRSPLR